MCCAPQHRREIDSTNLREKLFEAALAKALLFLSVCFPEKRKYIYILKINFCVILKAVLAKKGLALYNGVVLVRSYYCGG